MGTSVFPPESRMKIAKSFALREVGVPEKMFISTNSPARILSVRSIRNCCENEKDDLLYVKSIDRLGRNYEILEQ